MAIGEPNEVVRALALFDPDVWQISSAPGVVTIVRRWTDDSADTVIILSPATAYSRRDNQTGQLVWKCSGPALEVARAVLALPAPQQPNAPAIPLFERTDPG